MNFLIHLSKINLKIKEKKKKECFFLTYLCLFYLEPLNLLIKIILIVQFFYLLGNS